MWAARQTAERTSRPDRGPTLNFPRVKFGLCCCFLCLSIDQAVVGSLPCKSSGYCSSGKVKTFKGDIATSGALQSALSACSYRDEIIMLATTLSVLDNALQLYDSLLNKIGLAHQIMLTSDEETCDAALAVRPSMCCVWSSVQLPEEYFQHQLRLWNVRRGLAARAVRMQYNVMVIDTDVVIFDDPYKYLKLGPFNNTHLMTMGETWPYEDNSLLNLGWLYVQNAKPDGPVAAILAEVPDRQLRYADNKAQRIAALWQAIPNCGTDEQLLFDDVVYGAALGRPVSVVSMNMCGKDDKAAAHYTNLTKVQATFVELMLGDKVFKKVTEQVPKEWQALVGSTTMMIKRAEVMWWHAQGVWPIEYGGETLPQERGPLSSAFRATLAAECRHPSDRGTCPMWPETTGAAAAEEAKSSPVENFALAPHWLVASFSARGVHGQWGQHPGHPVQQVIGHIHQTPCDAFVGKRAITQYLGHYNWSLARQIKGPGVFFASQPFVPLPKAVALVPCLQLGRIVHNLEDFKEILRGMAAMAALLEGRAILYPDLPCGLPFIEAVEGGAAAVPLRLRNDFMARGPLRGEGSAGKGALCSWQPFMTAGCVSAPLLSLMAWEWEEYRSALAEKGVLTEAAAGNTLSMVAAMAGKPACPDVSGGSGGNGGRTRRRRGVGSEVAGNLGGIAGGAGAGVAGAGVAGGAIGSNQRVRRRRSRGGDGTGTEISGGGDLDDDSAMLGRGRRHLLHGSEAELVGATASLAEDEEGEGVELPSLARGRRREGGGGAGAGGSGDDVGQRGGRRGGGALIQKGGGGGGGIMPYVWEADADLLLKHLLDPLNQEQVIYLRRPIVVTWGQAAEGSELAQLAKLRYDNIMAACDSLTPDPAADQSTLVKKQWSVDMMNG